MSTPIFLVRWRLRRLGYWLIRSHCSCRPQCYFVVKRSTDAVTICDMTPAETRKNAVAWVKQNMEIQERMRGTWITRS